MGHSVVKPEVIATRLGRLREYVAILKSLRKYPRDRFVNDPVIRGSAERYLHLAIECCLDLGNHVIADRGLRKPQDYKEIFLIHGEAKILPSAFAKKIAPMGGFRNILVHDYLRVDPIVVRKFLQTHLTDFERFAKAFAKYL